VLEAARSDGYRKHIVGEAKLRRHLSRVAGA